MHVLTTLSGKQVQLEWGTYAMHLYCKKQGIDLKEFGQQIASAQFSIEVMVGLLQAAAFAATKAEPDFEEVCDWIDDCGGLLAPTGPLHDFCNYIIERTVLKTSDPVSEEKKSQLTA